MRNTRANRKINWIVPGIILLPLLAVGAYFWATAMLSSLENYRSALRDSAPIPGEALGDPITGKLVIILIDALRYDTASDPGLMPNIDQLRQQGAWSLMKSRSPSFSAPGWTTLLTGAWPEINDSQPMNPPDEDNVRAFTQNDVFEAANQAGLRTAVSGYSWFEGMLKNSGVDAGFYTEGEDDAADREVVAAALPWLDQDYQLILVHIDQVDYAGHHEGGPKNQNWAAAANRADAMVGELTARMNLAEETVIILSDHGQIDKGGHGGNEPVTRHEPFLAAGKGILPGQYSDINMVDIAPTVAVLLGTNIPASNQGRPLLEMLDVSTDRTVHILEQVKKQQSTLLEAYATAIGQPAAEVESDSAVGGTQIAMEQTRIGRLASERVWRNMISLLFAIVPAYLLILARNKKALWHLAGGLVYLAIFMLRFLLVDRNTFGLSWIPGQMEFILYLATTSGISLLGGWLTVMLGLKAFHLQPKQAAKTALGSAWMIIYLLMLPILLNFSVNGVATTWTLPELTTYFLGLFSLTQLLFVAAFGMILTGISALISKFLTRRSS